MEQIRIVTTATVLSVGYSVEQAQEDGVVEYEVDAPDVVGKDVDAGEVSLEIGDQVSREVFGDVRAQIEEGEMSVIGLMVPQYLLPYYLNNFGDELEVYPL